MPTETHPPVPLSINPKFKKLLRPLSGDEQQRLEWSVLKDGILDPIKVWVCDGKTYIIDGHNRYDIYQRYPTDIPSGYTIRELEFTSEDEVLEWIIENQLRRRNLNQNERVLYLGQLFEMRKKRRGGLHKNEDGGATAEQIAEEQEVSSRTVTRAAEIARAFNDADKEMQEKFATGEISQAELLRTIRKREEDKELGRDKLHNAQTAAIAALGERFLRTIKALRNLTEDYREVCKATGIDLNDLAPNLGSFGAGSLTLEEAQAEGLTTAVYVGGLCPEPSGPGASQCQVCYGVTYLTAQKLEPLKSHFGIDDKVKAAK